MKICGRCGKKLVDKRGLPVFDKDYCSPECRKLIDAARTAFKRARIKSAKRQCSGCNRSTRSYWVEVAGRPVALRSLHAAFQMGRYVEKKKLKVKYGRTKGKGKKR